MTKTQAKKMFDDIVSYYESKEDIAFLEGSHNNDGERACAYFDIKVVLFPAYKMEHPTEWEVLDLLHEIGHVETNTEEMPRYEREFRATQWAANRAKELKISVKKLYKETYQDYIFDTRTEDLKRKGTKRISKEKLIVKW